MSDGGIEVLSRLDVKKNWLLLALLAVSLFHLFFSVDYFRLSSTDDADYASLMFAHIKDFSVYKTPLDGETMIFRSSFIQTLLYAPVMYLFDESLYAHRYVSVLLALANLMLLFLIFERMSDTRHALMLIPLVSLVGDFVRSAHLARPEMLVMFCMYLSLYVQQRGNDSGRTILASFIAGVSVVVHPSGILAVILHVTYGILSKRVTRQPLSFYFFSRMGIGLGLAFLLFVFDNYHFWAVLLQSASGKAAEHLNVGWLMRVAVVFGAPTTLKEIFYFVQLPLPLLLVAGAALVLDRKSFFDIPMLLFLVLFLAYFALGKVSPLYWILFTPFLWFQLVKLCNKVRIFQPVYWFFLLGFCTIWAGVWWHDGEADPSRYIRNIKEITRPFVNDRTKVVGLPNHWFIFRNQPFDIAGEAEIRIKSCNLILLLPHEYFHPRGENITSRDNALYRSFRSIKKEDIADMKKIGEVFDEHYGSVANGKNNVLTIYYRPC